MTLLRTLTSSWLFSWLLVGTLGVALELVVRRRAMLLRIAELEQRGHHMPSVWTGIAGGIAFGIALGPLQFGALVLARRRDVAAALRRERAASPQLGAVEDARPRPDDPTWKRAMTIRAYRWADAQRRRRRPRARWRLTSQRVLLRREGHSIERLPGGYSRRRGDGWSLP